MPLVPLPSASGWHFVNIDHIVAVRPDGPRRSVVILAGSIQLETSEDSHVINKRIEDFVKFQQSVRPRL